VRTKSPVAATAIVGALAFVLAGPEAHAQRHRRHHHGTTGTTDATTDTPGSGGSDTPAPATGSPAAPEPGATTPAARAAEPAETGGGGGATSRGAGSSRGSAASAAPASSASSASASATTGTSTAAAPAHTASGDSQVLVSNVINRPSYHATRANLEIFVSVSPGAWAWPWGGFVLGAGMRLGVPLTRNGPMASLNNDFRLMIGAQIYGSVTPIPYWWLNAPVTLQWNFFLSDQWSVLLEAGLTVDVFTYDLINCYDHPRLYCDRVLFHPAGAFGLRRHLTRNVAPGFPAVEFRFTYPGGVQVAFAF
jgi:hypothetical protein